MKDWIAPVLAIVVGVLGLYVLVMLMVGFANSITLNHACVENGGTWIANPLTIGITGVCK